MQIFNRKVKRDSQEYQELKLAHQLANSDEWKRYLKPLIEKRLKSSSHINQLEDFNSILKAQSDLAYRDCYASLLSLVERNAKQFLEIEVKQ